jgi:NAD(P)-dependent dehydrogenase (short-subunit alcohol dehydrogenase family)
MTSLFDVRNRVVVVTGGAGQLGRQFTTTLLNHGARVCVFDIHPPLPGDDPSLTLKTLKVDITDRDAVQRGLSQVQRDWGIPHALVNNAAMDSPPNAPADENGPFETYPEESWDAVMKVNVKGAFFCSQAIGGAMASAGRGVIVNISSVYGLVSPNQTIYEYRRAKGEPFFKPAAYSASKAALLNLTRYLATYWAPQNVRVNTLTLHGVQRNQDPKFLESYCRLVPMGRLAREDEYNGALLFLISDASSYMTGSNLVIDGGWTAW